MSRAHVEDTYAEAFKSLYAEVLITARDRTWLDHAVNAATGNGSSTILCDCEAGLDRYVGPGGDESFATPDGRPGAIIQLHVPRFRKDRVEALERSLLVRISQNVLTCATAACFNLLDTDPYYKLGRKIAYFGDGYQFRDVRHGRRVWVIPILGGEFVVDRRFGYREGLMGGNIWYFGKDVDSALAAAERGVTAIEKIPGVIMPFPGGIAGSGSKAGSKYSFTVASTYEKFCPTLRKKLGEKSLPGIMAAGWARASSTCTRTSSRRSIDLVTSSSGLPSSRPTTSCPPRPASGSGHWSPRARGGS